MPHRFGRLVVFGLAIGASWNLAAVEDPLAPLLDGRPPEIVRVLPAPAKIAPGIAVERIVFRSHDNAEIFALIARPLAPGPHPGLLVLHGGGGSAEVEKAQAWAQRGYLAVAPDLPGIAEPKKLVESKGRWSALAYGEGRWTAAPDASASVIFDAVSSAMRALYLLRAQPDVIPDRIGVVGISWGGYLATMVCGLAGEQVRAAFSVYGCGFYELTAQRDTTLAQMPPEERARWLQQLDAGRRANGIKATFFIAGAANDFFFWPQAVQATLDAIPGEKNHLYAPNANHKAPLPGGSLFPAKAVEPFVPTAFQPYPTPTGNKANWLAMEVPFFEYHLKGHGEPLPQVAILPSSEPALARFAITAPRPLRSIEIYWAAAGPEVPKRVWKPVPVEVRTDQRYAVTVPAEAAEWFVVASDDRPATVSSRLMRGQNLLRQPLVLKEGGTAAKPAIFDGQGLTIDLGRDVTAHAWRREGELWYSDGKICEWAPPDAGQFAGLFVDEMPLSIPRDLAGERTAPDKKSRCYVAPVALQPGQMGFAVDGSIYFRWPKGKIPGAARLILPPKPGTSAVTIACSHIIVRNITAKYAANDGFNIHNRWIGIRLENVRAISNADEGISAHDDVEMAVDGAEVAWNGSVAGGVTDVNRSTTRYANCRVHDNLGAAFAFEGGSHRVTDTVIYNQARDFSVAEGTKFSSARIDFRR